MGSRRGKDLSTARHRPSVVGPTAHPLPAGVGVDGWLRKGGDLMGRSDLMQLEQGGEGRRGFFKHRNRLLPLQPTAPRSTSANCNDGVTAVVRTGHWPGNHWEASLLESPGASAWAPLICCTAVRSLYDRTCNARSAPLSVPSGHRPTWHDLAPTSRQPAAGSLGLWGTGSGPYGRGERRWTSRLPKHVLISAATEPPPRNSNPGPRGAWGS